MRRTEKIVKVNEFVLTESEAVVVMHALDYLHHRQSKHAKAMHINIKLVQDLRSVLRGETHTPYTV